MQMDPADFMSAAQMSKDRRECRVVLKSKHRLRASVCSQRGMTELQNRRKGRDTSEMQNTAAERLQVVQHESDGQNENS